MDAIEVREEAAERIAGALDRAGFEIRPMDDLIRAPGRTISTTHTPPLDFIPSSGLFLLQFTAPAIPAWQGAVRASGVTVVDYLPERAILISATEPQIRGLARQPWVQYIAPFVASDKFMPEAADTHTDFLVRFVDTPESAAQVALVRQQAGGFVSEERSDASVIVRLRISAADARVLLSNPFVVAIEPYSSLQLSDERQGLSLEGVLTPATPPAQRYLSWLATFGITPSNLTASQIVVDIADSGIDWGYSWRSSEWSQWHPDLQGRVVYHNGTVGGGDFPKFRDRESHGTIIASIVGGLPPTQSLDDINAANARLYGLGIAPGVRMGNTQIAGTNGVPSGAYSPSTWTRLAVTQPCYPVNQIYATTPPSGSACVATVQTYSSNIYTPSTAGTYGMYSRAFDSLVRDADPIGSGNTPLAITISSGNYGQDPGDTSKYALPPATAKNVIAVGAVESMRDFATATFTNTCASAASNLADANSGYSTVAWVTKRGTTDGRLKPDILAPATMTLGARSTSLLPSLKRCAYYPDSAPMYHGNSGTSFAAPVAAGSIALLRLKYGALSPAMYKAMLTAGARSITSGTDRLGTTLGTSTTVTKWPNEQQGFGVINLRDLLGSSPVKDRLDQTRVMLNGETYTRTVNVADASRDLKIVLAWTDAPAAETASVTLVNDLDLRVNGPFRFYGNLTNTSNGYSTLNPGCGRPLCGAGFNDARNNVEIINIKASEFVDPAKRSFNVEVRAFLNGVGVPGASAVGVSNQDFALFIINGTLAP